MVEVVAEDQAAAQRHSHRGRDGRECPSEISYSLKSFNFEGVLIEILDQHQVDGTRIAILVLAFHINQAAQRKRQIR